MLDFPSCWTEYLPIVGWASLEVEMLKGSTIQVLSPFTCFCNVIILTIKEFSARELRILACIFFKLEDPDATGSAGSFNFKLSPATIFLGVMIQHWQKWPSVLSPTKTWTWSTSSCMCAHVKSRLARIRHLEALEPIASDQETACTCVHASTLSMDLNGFSQQHFKTFSSVIYLKC